MSRGGKKSEWDKWLDGLRLAGLGIWSAMKTYRFWAFFVPVFVIFGTLLNLLSGGTSAFNLFWATDFGGKTRILGDAFLAIFGVGRPFVDWLIVFVVTLLQAILISSIAVAWKRNKDQESLQSSGIAAGLAILGSGCPTCGTALLTPVLATIFSTGGYAIAGIVSQVITWLSVVIVLFALYKVGNGLMGCKLERKKDEKLRKNN